jgi:hypothetical protein
MLKLSDRQHLIVEEKALAELSLNMTMKVPTKEELIHLKIQAAMRENAFIDSELKYLGEKEGHHWYLVAGEHEVSANQIEEFEQEEDD